MNRQIFSVRGRLFKSLDKRKVPLEIPNEIEYSEDDEFLLRLPVDVTDAELSRLADLADFPQLVSIDLSGCRNITARGLRRVLEMPHVRSLDCSYCYSLLEPWSAVRDSFHTNYSIQNLIIKHIPRSESKKDREYLCCFLAQFSGVRTIDFTGSRTVAEAFFDELRFNFHKELPTSLEQLCLRDTSTGRGTLSILCRLKELKELDLAGAYRKKSAPEIAEFLSPLTNLESLTLEHVTPEFTELFARMPKLKHLTIQNFESDQGCWQAITNLFSLRTLSVHGTIAHDEDSSAVNDEILERISALTHLKRLDINGRHLSEQAPECLSSLKNLKDLSLRGWLGGEESAQSVYSQYDDEPPKNLGCNLEFLKLLPKLETLSLEECNLVFPNLSALRHQPDLSKLDLSGLACRNLRERDFHLIFAYCPCLSKLTLNDSERGGLETFAGKSYLNSGNWFPLMLFTNSEIREINVKGKSGICQAQFAAIQHIPILKLSGITFEGEERPGDGSGEGVEKREYEWKDWHMGHKELHLENCKCVSHEFLLSLVQEPFNYKYANLSGMDISDEVVNCWADRYTGEWEQRSLRDVKHLSLRKTQITDESLEKLKIFCGLERLDVSPGTFSDSTIADFHEERPYCMILEW